MNRDEVVENIGELVTMNGMGDLAMSPEYRKYIGDKEGKFSLRILKLTRGGMVHLEDTTNGVIHSVPPKNVDLL